jgi:hypothetical protein
MQPAALKFLNSELIKHSVPASKIMIVIPIQSKADCNTDLLRQASASSLFVMFPTTQKTLQVFLLGRIHGSNIMHNREATEERNGHS